VRRKRNLLILAVACAAPLAALTAGAARADTITPITQLSGFNQMVVDASANYIFMSGGGSIVVTDLTGKYVATVDAGDGVEGIALSPDGTTLYAALTAGTAVTNTVAAINVSTVTATTPTQTTYALGTGDVPHSLAVQSGTLWVSYQSPTGPGAIGNIDLTSGTFTAASAPGTWASAPDLAADPSDTGVLVAVLPGTNPAKAATFSTTATTATAKASQATLGATASPCEYEHQIAVVPGGAEFIVACGAPVNENAYSTQDLSVRATYDTGNTYPGGVAVDTDGTVAVSTYGPNADVRVYDADGTLLNVFNLGESNQVVAMNGLAWEDTTPGPELAAMEQATGPFRLEVFDQPKVTRSALTLTTPGTAVIGKAITLTGSLTLSNGAALPAKSTVTVTRSGPGGTRKTFPAVSPGSKGGFTVTDKPPATGKYTYTASYAGDGQITTSATATATVTVKPYSARLGLRGPSHIYIGKSVTLTGTLVFGSGSVPARTRLTVTRTGHGATRQFTVSTGAKGAFRVTDTPAATGTYTYAVRYAGSATTAPATVSRKLSVILNPVVLTVTTNGAVFTYEPTVRITAHLGPTYRNRSVKVYARWLGSKGSTLIKTGRVNSRGDLTVSYQTPHSTTFSVVFGGDAHYAAKTVARTVYVRANVSESISGYYGSEHVGGTLYRLYHSSDLLYASASVAPDKRGECVEFEVQEYYEGTWNPNVATGCVRLSSSSRAAAAFGLTHADQGYPYRIRADYGGDTSNESGDSGWLYLMVES
jgi:sugar lactone lactonase YvrE